MVDSLLGPLEIRLEGEPGRNREAVAAAEQLIRVDPLRERPRAVKMRALV